MVFCGAVERLHCIDLKMANLIRLTLEDVITDDADAVRDHARATAKNWHRVGIFEKNKDLAKRFLYRKFSYRAERAAVIWFGIKDWERDPDGFGKAGVGGFSVRLGSEKNYGLVAHLSRDKEKFPYLLVEKQDDLLFRIVGVLPVVMARQMKMEGIGRALPGNTAPWLIPQAFLKQFIGDDYGKVAQLKLF